MSESTSPQVPVDNAVLGQSPPLPVARIDQIGQLLGELDRTPVRAAAFSEVLGPQVDNQLVQVRLGIASGLFAALRCRYAGTAAHGLRVALGCSSWAVRRGLDTHQRDVIEVAALLHDVGIVGVPDQVLFKPGPLEPDESLLFEQARRMSVEILRTACAESAILEIVENIAAWYDGSRGGTRVMGAQIPLGARMIAVVEAYDSMTTDHVFRRAMSQERALGELFQAAGRQFDPELVREFAEFQAGDQTAARRETAQRWLRSLDPEAADSFWQLQGPNAPAGLTSQTDLFQAKLLDHMHDAVLFIDAALRILQWNHGAERLTGIASSSICLRTWAPGLLNMQNEKGDQVADDDCPVVSTLRSGVQSLRRLTIRGRGGRAISVDSHAMPVTAPDGRVLGTVLLLHDASSEISLEERCQSLHEKATRDALTQVANRAEFDRVHELFVSTHRDQQMPCALIICDIDHFKQVNDRFGHQAGDEAIKALAAVLRNSCRSGDLVARYGGEEFVVLCAHCDNASAARRAEQIRKTIAQQAQPALGGRSITVSFGVTELQPGDTPETMLRRADRALLLAKEQGRNRVVQLGIGADADFRTASVLPGQRPWSATPAIRQVLVTPVPIAVAIEKLRGFVADHKAKIVKTEGNEVQLHIDDPTRGRLRRAADRPVAFRLDLRLAEEHVIRSEKGTGVGCPVAQTRIFVSIVPMRGRDRRRADSAERARQVAASLRSYLMATQEKEEPEVLSDETGLLGRVGRLFQAWTAGK